MVVNNGDESHGTIQLFNDKNPNSARQKGETPKTLI